MKRGKSDLFEWIKALAIAVIIAIVVRSFIFTNYIVDGSSMMPTLQDGNRLIVNKIDYDFTQPKRFDIIIFHATPTDDYVKRVIGLPGDTVQYKNDTLYVNGKKYDEPYLKPYKEQISQGNLTYDFTLKDIPNGQERVPKGKVFVLGDNRRNSQDSRYFGFVDMDKIVGKVNVRYWPFDEFKYMH
ncbi:signal peptidase I [Pullulanibacillus pueri]|uniref:Signal peptidase I n=1 Tax=Pullulanibacillus pueri TaxID=1437324 RepID=A0A8J2ZX36_9BACL|nr:signal peptidase I [Pullulanibacillus pueri]MBM7683578.1 signal peptidase I [Pullulanibacillus pueri]GGH84491.1 signal peptidase I [Pullulanibacillus pueri]